MKLGKRAPRAGAIRFMLANYIDKSTLPIPPDVFGHEGMISNWGMLGNDSYGDCVWAGAAHETMLWNQEAGNTVAFTDRSVLSDYAAATGFNPSDSNTDQGTDVASAAAYRRKTGIVDATGKRHTVAAYLAIKTGDIDELKIAMYLFGAVGVGIEFPTSAMDQFNKGQPWDPVTGATIDGGHYIPMVAFRGNFVCITWSKLQPITSRFLTTYCDEAIAYVSSEMLINNKSPEGFDSATLLADLTSLPT